MFLWTNKGALARIITCTVDIFGARLGLLRLCERLSEVIEVSAQSPLIRTSLQGLRYFRLGLRLSRQGLYGARN